MIRKVLALGLAISGVAYAQERPTPTEAPDGEDPLAPYRQSVGVMANRTIGTASRPVVFNWRQSRIMVGATGQFLMELNNFNSGRVGASVRTPVGGALAEVAVSWAHVGGSRSAELLALTPYRQPGRPSRIELDLGLGVPVAEGIVTASPGFIPATQLVLSLQGMFRYRVYPTGWGGLTPRQVGTRIVSPSLSDEEIDNLDGVRLPGMEIDRGRYEVLVGLGNDVYFESGFFISTRALFAVPVLAPVSGTDLPFYADLGVSLGMALGTQRRSRR